MPHASKKTGLEAYLTIGEAAEFLGVSPSTLRNWDRQGKLTPHRHPINGYRLYLKTDLERIPRRIRKPNGR